MSRETASRDMALNTLAVLTGGLTAAAFVGTGLVTGLAADATAQQSQAKAASKAAAAQLAALAPQTVATPLPVRTVVTNRVVQGTLPAAPAPARAKGSVRAWTPAPAKGAVRAQAPVRTQVVAPAPSAAS
jgi:hypothetical protein